VRRTTPVYHGERFAELLGVVPRFLRAIPPFRRYFCQRGQVERANELGERLFEELDW
jgi:hypothetical protein